VIAEKSAIRPVKAVKVADICKKPTAFDHLIKTCASVLKVQTYTLERSRRFFFNRAGYDNTIRV
jgi:hypothetical protein